MAKLCQGLKRGRPPDTSDPCECSKARGRYSQWFTSAFLYTLSPMKIPKEPKRKYLTAVLYAAKPFLWYFSYTGWGPAPDPTPNEPSNPTFPQANLQPCFKLRFEPPIVVYCWLQKNALKIAEFLRANKKRIRRKHEVTGGWKYHVCHWECQCRDLRGEGKKISLGSAYLTLHL